MPRWRINIIVGLGAAALLLVGWIGGRHFARGEAPIPGGLTFEQGVVSTGEEEANRRSRPIAEQATNALAEDSEQIWRGAIAKVASFTSSAVFRADGKLRDEIVVKLRLTKEQEAGVEHALQDSKRKFEELQLQQVKLVTSPEGEQFFEIPALANAEQLRAECERALEREVGPQLAAALGEMASQTFELVLSCINS